MAYRENKGIKEKRETLAGLRGSKEIKETKGQTDISGQMEHRVTKVGKAFKVLEDYKETKVIKE
jgi:hypothetical protein